MPGIFDNIFSGGGLFGGQPQQPQYDWLPQQQKPGFFGNASTNQRALMGLGLGLAGGATPQQGMQLGLQGMMAGANNDILMQQRLDALNQHREQQAAVAAFLNTYKGKFSPETLRLLAANPKAWEAIGNTIVSPKTTVTPSGDVMREGVGGELSFPAAVPIAKETTIAGPQGEKIPATQIMPNLRNLSGTITTPQILGGGQPISALGPGQIKSLEKQGDFEGGAITELPKSVESSKFMLSTIDKALKHPGFSWGTGMTSFTSRFPGTPAYDFARVIDQIKGKTFLEAFQSLKGGGQITEVEGQKATDAVARLDRAQTEGEFKNALKDLRDVVYSGQQRALIQANKTRPYVGGMNQGLGPPGVSYDRPEIGAAREAIAKGAPREAVMRRLMENKIPFRPSDLDL